MSLIESAHANSVIESFIQKGLSKRVHECRFVRTNFTATKMKIHLQPKSVPHAQMKVILVLMRAY